VPADSALTARDQPRSKHFPTSGTDSMSSSDEYLREALRSRSLADREFDCVYPPHVRLVSRRFWTPLAVAWRAAARLDALNATRVLDIGSGAGKFCIAAAAQAPHIAFVGVEHRSHFVDTAREVSSRMGTSNARFFVGDATRARLDRFDALYLFNPFAENVFDDVEQLDSTVELSLNRYESDLGRIRSALTAARIGTIVVTYHGFGASLPTGYECLSAEPVGSDRLCLWRKTHEAPARVNSIRQAPVAEIGLTTDHPAPADDG
jgi:SAM-dependent methyltransferase